MMFLGLSEGCYATDRELFGVPRAEDILEDASRTLGITALY